jgi:hypothetical protein
MKKFSRIGCVVGLAGLLLVPLSMLEAQAGCYQGLFGGIRGRSIPVTGNRPKVLRAIRYSWRGIRPSKTGPSRL